MRPADPTPPSPDAATIPEANDEPVPEPTLGPFRLGRPLGAGGMGVVFEARDTTLSRTVALKLLRPGGADGAAARARLVREAQALARLTHPNVVTVYSVGTAGEQVYIAMELVDGITLREWMRQPHPWREVVSLFAAVGRGLAAAHQLGLVHRDVKPANIFLDRSGTPKIGDFGLVVTTGGAADDDATAPGDGAAPDAAARADAAAPADATAPTGAKLTMTGALLGTPAYMAPEQLDRRPVDHRADQYAFCVSLHEALTGHLPRAVVAPDAPAPRPIPRRIRAVLDRGLADDPVQRYRSMAEVVRALERAVSARRRVAIAAGAVAIALVSAAAAWAIAPHPADEAVCAAPTGELAAVWNPTRRAALRAHLTGLDARLGGDRADRVEAQVDRFTTDWLRMRVDACRATRVRGIQSDELLARRVDCLQRRLDERDLGVGLVAAATTLTVADDAIAGLAKAPPIDLCADLRALGAAAPLPEAPDARAKVLALDHELADLEVRTLAGPTAALKARAEADLARARALDYPPAIAQATRIAARSAIKRQDAPAARALLIDLTRAAARAHDDRSEAFAWTKLLGLAGDDGHTELAAQFGLAAEAAVIRAGDPIDLRADLLYEQGVATQYTPQVGDGVKLLEQAVALLERMGATSDTSPYAARYAYAINELGVLRARSGDLDGGIAKLREGIRLYQQHNGHDSADEAWGWLSLAARLRDAGRLDEALAAAGESIRIGEARYGESVFLRSGHAMAGDVLGLLHRWREALAAYERAVAGYREDEIMRDPYLRGYDAARASVMARLGQADEARRVLDVAVAADLAEHDDSGDLGTFLVARADLEAGRGRCASALDDYVRGITDLARVGVSMNGPRQQALVHQAECLLELGRAADAAALLDGALALPSTGGQAVVAARARFDRARAQVELGGEPAAIAAARAAARAARADLAAAAPDPDELAAVDRWLAAHP